MFPGSLAATCLNLRHTRPSRQRTRLINSSAIFVQANTLPLAPRTCREFIWAIGRVMSGGESSITPPLSTKLAIPCLSTDSAGKNNFFAEDRIGSGTDLNIDFRGLGGDDFGLNDNAPQRTDLACLIARADTRNVWRCARRRQYARRGIFDHRPLFAISALAPLRLSRAGKRKSCALEPVYFWGRALFRRDASCPSLSAELLIFNFAARTCGKLGHRPTCVRDWRVHLFLDASATSSRCGQFFCRQVGHVLWRTFSPHFRRTSPASVGNDVGTANFLWHRRTV